MDQSIVNRKIDSLYRCIQRIDNKCPDSSEQLKADLDLQDVIVLNISRAVQLCVDIAAHLLAQSPLPVPSTMGETFQALSRMGVIDEELAIRLRKSVGFRNLAVHNYHDLNWDIVFAVASKNLADFKSFATRVTHHIGQS